MQRPTPTFLRLYPDAIARGDGLARLLKKRTGQADPRLLSYFAFKNDERRFAVSLLERHARFWLFRTHQARFAGDFVAVDMSERRVKHRSAFCVDLKRGAKLVLGGGGAGNAFVGLDRLVSRLARERGVVTPDHSLVRATGDGQRLVRYLSAS